MLVLCYHCRAKYRSRQFKLCQEPEKLNPNVVKSHAKPATCISTYLEFYQVKIKLIYTQYNFFFFLNRM